MIVGVVEKVVFPVTVDVAVSASVPPNVIAPEKVEEDELRPPVNAIASVRSINVWESLPFDLVTGINVVADDVAL